MSDGSGISTNKVPSQFNGQLVTGLTSRYNPACLRNNKPGKPYVSTNSFI
jgi:hypothetical protein